MMRVHEGLYENPRPSQKSKENRRSLDSVATATSLALLRDDKGG